MPNRSRVPGTADCALTRPARLPAAIFFFLCEHLALHLLRPPLAKYLARRFKKAVEDVDRVLEEFCYGGQMSSMAHVLVQVRPAAGVAGCRAAALAIVSWTRAAHCRRQWKAA